MSSERPAISIQDVAKSYRINTASTGATTVAEALVQRAKHPLRRAQRETFWALQDVSVDVNEGDVLGVIGRNGAGKSTLLKLLSRITPPTRGRIDVYGRIGSLLEVGTGFHPELTGRENIFLNGAILGMKRREIKREFDAIVDFAGTGQFLDTPVKRYSSGMYVRLAFAVAAHLSSEILLVDEVLAVGDADFQEKCLRKMHSISGTGRTVVFVSHNMNSVASLCDRVLFLEWGKASFIGPVREGVSKYLNQFGTAGAAPAPERRSGSGEFRYTMAEASSPSFDPDEEKVIEYRIERKRPGNNRVWLSCHVVDSEGRTLLQCDSRLTGHVLELGDVHEGHFVLRTPWLKPGRYYIDLYIVGAGIVDDFEHALEIEVNPTLPYPVTGPEESYKQGEVFGDFRFENGLMRASTAPRAESA